jgi:ubiquinone/menaquinone biosynthesis C-methylase UbiE
MNNLHNNKKIYSRFWKAKKVKECSFWFTWEKFKALIPKRGSKLLDVGCGIRPRIPIRGSYFLDLSKSALKTLSSLGGICTCADATNMPYDDNFFDFVNASELLEHIDDDKKVLSEVYRVLKPSGHFSFSVPMGMKFWTKFDDAVYHVRRYESHELHKKVIDSNFKIKSYYINKPSKSQVYKNAAAFVFTKFPKLALLIEENINLHISKWFQRLRKQAWYTDRFVERLKDACGVICICQKQL